MKNRTLGIIAVILAQVTLVAADVTLRGIEHLSFYRKTTYAPVFIGPSSEGYIDVSIKAIEVNETLSSPQHLEKYQIPILIVPQEDVLRFKSNLGYMYFEGIEEDGDDSPHIIETYFDMEKNRIKDEVDGEPLDPIKYYNSQFTIASPVHFPVTDSKIYYIFICPFHSQGIRSLDVEVVFKNSYGYLPFPSYVVFQESKLALVIGLIEVTMIYFAIFKYKTTPGLFSTANLSLVSKVTVFYVFIPFFIVSLIETTAMGLRNRAGPTHYGGIYVALKVVIRLFRTVLYIFADYLILLFAMGYGVVYSKRGTSGNHKVFPSRLQSTAKFLLIMNICVFLLYELSELCLFSDFAADIPEGFVKFHSNINTDFLYTLNEVSQFLLGSFPVVWFAYVGYYITETNVALNQLSNEVRGIGRKFNLTVFLTLTIEIISVLFLLIYTVFHSSNRSTNRYTHDWREYRRKQIQEEESLLFNYKNEQTIFWLQDANIQLLILVFYFFWIRDNSGLVAKKPFDGYELDGESV